MCFLGEGRQERLCSGEKSTSGGTILLLPYKIEDGGKDLLYKKSLQGRYFRPSFSSPTHQFISQ